MSQALFRSAAHLAPVVVAVLYACGGDPSNPSSSDSTSQRPAASVGGDGPASLTGVSPASGLLGRELDVMIMGDATRFDSDAVVDFGEGIRVSNLMFVSPTSMSAHLQIADSTATGPRDVVVESGGSRLMAHDAFRVEASIDATVRAGFPVQGGLLMIDLKNHDSESFGTTALVGSVSSLGSADVGGGGAPNSGDSAFTASFLAFVDPLAPPGPTGLEAVNLSSSLNGATIYSATFSTGSQAVDVQPARAAEFVPPGTTPHDGQVLAPYSSRLYRTAAPSAGLISISVTPTGARLVPRLNVYPSSGRSDDFIGWTASSTATHAGVSLTYPVQGSSDTYAVVSDVGLGGGGLTYEFSIASSFTPVTLTPETIDPHYATGLAQQLCDASVQHCLLAGRIAGNGEWDVYVLPMLPAGSHWVVFARVESDVRVWLTEDPWLRQVGSDITPQWPQHLSVASVPSGSSPTYLIVEGREGGAKPLGDYLLATSQGAN